MVVILDLVFNADARRKLRARKISTDEVYEVLALGPLVDDNPEPRVPGSRVAIGPTYEARMLTVVIQPDESSATRWHVMTAWESSVRQIADYERDS